MQTYADIIATHQASSTDKTAAQHLYPLRFLRSAAELERTRQTFLARPSTEAESAYDTAFNSATDAYESDLALFTADFERVVSDDLMYKIPIGIVSKESQRATLHSLAQALAATRATYERRQRCLTDDTFSCDVNSLAPPALSRITSVSLDSDAIAQAQTIRSLLKNTYEQAVDSYREGPLIALPESSCLGDITAAPLFLFSHPSDAPAAIATPRFVGDMALIDTGAHPDDKYISYYAKHTAPYYFYELVNFYSCPKLLADASRLSVAREIVQFAQEHPLIALASSTPELKALESKFSGPVLQEGDALEYIRMVQGKLPSLNASSQKKLLSLALKASERSGELPDFIARVVKEEQRNEYLAREGFPIDRSIGTFFGGRSAFFSLFLGSNPSVAGEQAGIASSVDVPATILPYTYFSNIKKSIPLSTLEQNLRRYFTLSKRE
jgi:hypothetical protein